MINEISLTPEHARALDDYERLRESLLQNEEEREYLLHQALPELEAIYLLKVGKLKLELLEVRIEVYRLKRKMELIQSCINRQSEIVPEAIDILLEKEIQGQRKKLEEESKKIEETLKFIGSPKMNSDEAIELRKIYYKLAHVLHPDLNPGQNETMKILWLKVSECYRQGDLNQMKLMEVLTFHEVKPDSSKRTLEELLKRNEVFSSRITQLLKEIELIQTNFPFTYKEHLNDPSWIDSENNDSLNAISKAQEEIAVYENAIEILLSGKDT
jgi:hypothetical protein